MVAERGKGGGIPSEEDERGGRGTWAVRSRSFLSLLPAKGDAARIPKEEKDSKEKREEEGKEWAASRLPFAILYSLFFTFAFYRLLSLSLVNS